MVQKIVYNDCFGSFAVHENVVKWVRENESKLSKEYDNADIQEIANSTISGEKYPDGSGPKSMSYIRQDEVRRDNVLLADIVSEQVSYDGQYNGDFSSLQVAEVPDNVSWTIDEYDGKETVREASRTFS